MGFATLLLAPFLATAKGRQIRSLTPRDYGLLAVVVDARTPARAEHAVAILEQKLQSNSKLIRSVRRPDAGDFFTIHGLLYLDVDELRDLATQVAEVQPFLGTLAADMSLGSLFTVLADAIDGVNDGDVSDANPLPIDDAGGDVHRHAE